MSLQLALAFTVTVLASVCTVAVIILLGWFLLWKALLSKFKLVRELFGLNEPQPQEKTKKHEAPVEAESSNRSSMSGSHKDTGDRSSVDVRVRHTVRD